MSSPTITPEEIQARRAAALGKQQAETKKLLARQDAIHALAYKLHQEAHADPARKEKPGFDVSLAAATKEVDEVAAAEAANQTPDIREPAES